MEDTGVGLSDSEEHWLSHETLLGDNSRTTASPGASTQKLLNLAIAWEQSAGRGHRADITLGNWHRWGGAGSKKEGRGKDGHQQRSVRL